MAIPSASALFFNIGSAIFELVKLGAIQFTLILGANSAAKETVRPSTAAITFSLEGVFGALAAWIILSQYLTITQIFGCLLILIGVLAAQLIPLFNKDAASSRYYTD